MFTQHIEPTFTSWRSAARRLLAAAVPPGEIHWSEDLREQPLFTETLPAALKAAQQPKVAPAFLDLAERVAAHTAPQRWALLYSLLWRLTHGGEKHLLALTTDAEVRRAQDWAKAVGRDIHKMHAFVRFRLVGLEEATGREQFVAWFEPTHRIVRLAAPFFQKRFTGMDWSILTPYECVHWDGEQLFYSEGVSKEQAPSEDALDGLWKTYFCSIFNPARLKLKAMQAEMPKKYWKNLPEAAAISELIQSSAKRVDTMLTTEERPVKPAPQNAYLEKLKSLPKDGSGS